MTEYLSRLWAARTSGYVDPNLSPIPGNPDAGSVKSAQNPFSFIISQNSLAMATN
eukprot:m.24571 g.24571  ORF g.24571 m.24571 type:complete len:55 (-) comp5670_c0_seq1:344-508(-)